jgi:hypothetical protein
MKRLLAVGLLALGCSSAHFAPDPRPPGSVGVRETSTCECSTTDTYESSCDCGRGDHSEQIAITCSRHRDSRTDAVCMDTCPPCADVCAGGPRELGCLVRQAP